MSITYIIKTEDFNSQDIKYFAKELNLSHTVAKKILKSRSCIRLFYSPRRNEIITELGNQYDLERLNSFNNIKLIDKSEYKNTKYNLMVQETDIEFIEKDKPIEIPDEPLKIGTIGNPFKERQISPELQKFFLSIQALQQFI